MIGLRKIYGRLFEAKCPTCGSSGAYHGFTSVECPNPSCMHHKPGMEPEEEPGSTQTQTTTSSSPHKSGRARLDAQGLKDKIDNGSMLIDRMKIENETIKLLSINGVTFGDCVFDGAFFTRCQFIGCDFINCQIGAEIDNCQFDDCSFSDCDFYTTWIRCALTSPKMSVCHGVHLMTDTVIEDGKISTCEFNDFAMKKSKIDDTHFIRTKMINAKLNDSTFVDCILDGISLYTAEIENMLFSQCDMARANIAGNGGGHGSILNTGFVGCGLEFARFDKNYLDMVRFDGCSLSAATFTNATIEQNCTFTNIVGKNIAPEIAPYVP